MLCLLRLILYVKKYYNAPVTCCISMAPGRFLKYLDNQIQCLLIFIDTKAKRVGSVKSLNYLVLIKILLGFTTILAEKISMVEQKAFLNLLNSCKTYLLL